MRTFISFLEHSNRFCIYIHNQDVTFGTVGSYALTYLMHLFQY